MRLKTPGEVASSPTIFLAACLAPPAKSVSISIPPNALVASLPNLPSANVVAIVPNDAPISLPDINLSSDWARKFSAAEPPAVNISPIPAAVDNEVVNPATLATLPNMPPATIDGADSIRNAPVAVGCSNIAWILPATPSAFCNFSISERCSGLYSLVNSSCFLPRSYTFSARSLPAYPPVGISAIPTRPCPAPTIPFSKDMPTSLA